MENLEMGDFPKTDRFVCKLGRLRRRKVIRIFLRINLNFKNFQTRTQNATPQISNQIDAVGRTCDI